MVQTKILTALGLMSGTSLDGIDAAIISTDGESIKSFGASRTYSYDPELREKIRRLLGRPVKNNKSYNHTISDLTNAHIAAVRDILAIAKKKIDQIDVIGFHGHTVFHSPRDNITCQIGDGALLARETGIKVIGNFRANDIAHGGQGAPLAPLFHKAIAEPLEKPLCVLNIGGVANLTWLSPHDGIVAFDTGPGNALLNDWLRKTKNDEMDWDGGLAKSGEVNESLLLELLGDPYLDKPYPKSLDRDYFSNDSISDLSPADGAATLTAFTAACVSRAVDLLPSPPVRWLVSGGGRCNLTMMAELRQRLSAEVIPVELAGWDGDALEAQAFGFLAVRSLYGLPLSLPTTTGCNAALSGGQLFLAE